MPHRHKAALESYIRDKQAHQERMEEARIHAENDLLDERDNLGHKVRGDRAEDFHAFLTEEEKKRYYDKSNRVKEYEAFIERDRRDIAWAQMQLRRTAPLR